MRHRPDPDQLSSSRAGCDRDLVRQVLSGGLPGEHAGLELLLRHRPTCWEHAVALLAPDRASRDALATLRHAWRTYGRIETPANARTR